MYCVCSVFFFQAEDGIRDADVTGVQTCALPISGRPSPPGRPLFTKNSVCSSAGRWYTPRAGRTEVTRACSWAPQQQASTGGTAGLVGVTCQQCTAKLGRDAGTCKLCSQGGLTDHEAICTATPDGGRVFRRRRGHVDE